MASSLNRSSFPASFFFGAGSSTYQFEGAAREDGKGPSIWDTFTHKYPERIADRTNGDVATNFYHRYKEDIKILKDMNLKSFRISISWPRILPNGTLSGGVNKKGIQFYNNVIDELLSNGITPFVTLFHWDLPQALQDEYDGFLSPRIVNDFRDYANICFEYFGDRVKYWITLNEPFVFSNVGYGMAVFPPNHCSMRESLLATHNQILAHASVVNLYRAKYKATQKGKIGITMIATWPKGYSPRNSTKNKNLKNQIKIAIDFMLGQFLDPLIKGAYPSSMRRLLGDQLPKFTRKQSEMIRKASFDFIGLNYYYSYLLKADIPKPSDLKGKCGLDVSHFVTFTDSKGKPLYEDITNSTIVDPKGIRDMMHYVDRKYNHPLIYITENGKDTKYKTTRVKQDLQDNFRIHYITQHLFWIRKAIMEGVNVKGYFVWSLLDGYEWAAGHTIGCGLNYVDYKKGLKRIPKLSALWIKNFLQK